MRFLLLLFLTIDFVCADGQDVLKELSYKQIKLGMTSEEIKSIPGLHFDKCNSSICIEDSFGNTLAGAAVERPVMIMMKNDQAGMIYIRSSSNNFGRISDAYILKYGVPTSKDEKEVQNRMGAKFSSSEYTWRTPDGYISLKERAGTIDKMSISIGLNSFIEKSAKDSEKAVHKNVEDL